MSAAKKIVKKGELLFKEGDKISQIFVVQSGSLSLCLQRGKKNIELFQVGSSHVLGEQALVGAGQYAYSALATTETTVAEIPVEAFKAAVEQSSQMVKGLSKSLIDRIKQALNEVKSSKLEKDSSPCPDDQVQKIFGAIFHTVKHKGTIEEGKPKDCLAMEWSALKQYAQRIFGESPKRIEQAINILVKLKLAEYVIGRPPEDPEAPEQILKAYFYDLASIEAFFEFYQYYFFKGAKTEILRVDEQIVALVKQFLICAEGLTPDRFGVITLDFQQTVERFKKESGISINPDHFTRMATKGLFAKRHARTDGTVVLQFDFKEFMNISKVWQILREIDKWNEKGFVDLAEEENKAKKSSSENCCPQCSSSIVDAAKFCSECGFKLAA